jgi:hypothetical protein
MVYLPTGRPDMTPSPPMASSGVRGLRRSDRKGAPSRRWAPSPCSLRCWWPAQAVATTPCWRGTRRCAKKYFTVSTGRTLRRLTIVTGRTTSHEPSTTSQSATIRVHLRRRRTRRREHQDHPPLDRGGPLGRIPHEATPAPSPPRELDKILVGLSR